MLFLVLCGTAWPAAPIAHPASAAPLDTKPEFLHNHPDIGNLLDNDAKWMIGGGYLYWARCYNAPSAATNRVNTPANALIGYLRRWSVTGGRAVTLSGDAFCNTAYWNADNSGLYYWTNGYIVRRGQDNPLTEVKVVSTIAPVARLALDATYVYWINSNGDLFRTPKGQPDPDDPRYTDYIGPAGANASNLILSADSLYWVADNVIYSYRKTCLNDCARTTIASENGASLIDATKTGVLFDSSVRPLWVLGQNIRGNWCRFALPGGNKCSPDTSYTVPTVNGQVWQPKQLATDGNYLFWVENFQNCGGLGCVDSQQGQLMKWKLHRGLNDTDPFLDPLPIAAQNSGGETYSIGSPDGTYPIAVGGGYVYFNTTQGLTRIRSDALPALPVIVADKWEVNQAIQSLSNDVPLVANKPTYVRIYGYKQSGPRANAVQAKLDAFRGNALDQYAGTIYPVNGALNFPLNATNSYFRGNLNDGWFFQLPDDWTNSGKIKLQVTVNGNSNYLLPTFNAKAPICVVAIPVRTNGPRASDSGVNYGVAVGMVKRLFPAPDVWTYHQDNDIAKLVVKWGGPFDLVPYPGFDPYSLPENQTRVLTSLTERDLLSDDPDKCDDAGARTHYVGIVSPESPTNNGKGGMANGSGRVGYDQLWFKMPPADIDSTNLTGTRIASLAHELGHNYGRHHIDCGGPDADDLDNGYPYDKCQLDNRDQNAFTTYFGFDTWTQRPLPPDQAGDLMTYAQNLNPAKPRWISDYTWRALYNGLNAAQVNAADAMSPSAVAFVQAQAVVYISGVYTETSGVLDYAWLYPSANLSAKVRQKWQRSLALTTAEVKASAAQANIHIRLLDSNGAVLDDRAVTPVAADSDSTTNENAFAFTFPAPAGQVARVELLNGDTILANLHPGAQAPTVTLLQPAGGETVDQQMTLAWRATDPDPDDHLLFTVQYSPDNGKTWRALLTNVANPTGNDTITLSLTELSGIPGSLPNGALIRVATSDGYHTTFATSQPFTVVNRAPQPSIWAPAGSQTYPAGQTVVVQGGADDAEDGGLSGAALRWTLDGAPIGNGSSASVEGLAPGRYTLTLTARDTAGSEKSVSAPLTVAPLSIPAGPAPTLDGDCNDEAYVNAAHVPLKPYADGERVTVLLQRADNYLYACFPQIKRAGGASPGSLAGMRVDVQHGREAQPQLDDRLFIVGEDGVPKLYGGTGDTWNALTPSGLVGRVSADVSHWSAEVQIDVNALGGWNHVVGLDVEHAWVNAPGDDYFWPYNAIWSNPSTWATTVLGDPPYITNLVPVSAPVGSGNFTLTVTGANFAAGATVQWQGVAQPTTVFTDYVQAQITAADLTAPGVITVTVVNPGMEHAPSNPLPFAVNNPVPVLTGAALNNNSLTVAGNNLVNGAQILWNGNPQATTVGNSGQLQALVDATALPVSQTRTVAVFNPGPGGGVSNLLTVSIPSTAPDVTPTGAQKVYLPLITR